MGGRYVVVMADFEFGGLAGLGVEADGANHALGVVGFLEFDDAGDEAFVLGLNFFARR